MPLMIDFPPQQYDQAQWINQFIVSSNENVKTCVTSSTLTDVASPICAGQQAMRINDAIQPENIRRNHGKVKAKTTCNEYKTGAIVAPKRRSQTRKSTPIGHVKETNQILRGKASTMPNGAQIKTEKHFRPLFVLPSKPMNQQKATKVAKVARNRKFITKLDITIDMIRAVVKRLGIADRKRKSLDLVAKEIGLKIENTNDAFWLANKMKSHVDRVLEKEMKFSAVVEKEEFTEPIDQSKVTAA